MEPDRHRAWVDICSELAEREFAAQRLVSGAEMAWGAAVHAVKFVAHQHSNLPTYGHDHVRLAVRRLNNEYPELRLSSDFGRAEMLHRHFYRGHRQERQVRDAWRHTQGLISNLLSLPPLP